MFSVEKLQEYEKFEKDIDAFVLLRKLDDELVFQSIAEESKGINIYSNHIIESIEHGNLEDIKKYLRELNSAAGSLKLMIEVAEERAKNNGN